YKVEDFPGYAFSTFRSYGQIAAAYGERALPKAAPTPRVRKLADEIAAGKKDQREVAKALYEWVSTNIQYAGNCIGLGAVVPRDQEFVLDNRIGDCKDHATLLQALLAAKNVPATQALINAGNVYQLPDIPVASSVNHVLNY
ncbi:transglutaminase family protein, partial [Lysobacter sp. 2RAB21]